MRNRVNKQDIPRQLAQLTLAQGRKPSYNTVQSSQGLIQQTTALVSGKTEIKEETHRVIKQNMMPDHCLPKIFHLNS